MHVTVEDFSIRYLGYVFGWCDDTNVEYVLFGIKQGPRG